MIRIPSILLALAMFAGTALTARAADQASCSIIVPSGVLANVQIVIVGPGAGGGCAAMLREQPGSYPTDRMPDQIGCGFRQGSTAILAGMAFGTNNGILQQACDGLKGMGTPLTIGRSG